MSAYHRLISYIYAYEGGVKGKNTGFAKLETRGTSCRIQVSVRRIFAGGSPIGVYLLAGQDEIRIGTLFVRGGNGEFRTVVNCENIEGSGCGMEECGGLTLHETDSAWRAYTTIWEDAVAHAAEVELSDVTAENVRQQEAKKEAAAQKQAERTQAETETEKGPEEEAEAEIVESEEGMKESEKADAEEESGEIEGADAEEESGETEETEAGEKMEEETGNFEEIGIGREVGGAEDAESNEKGALSKMEAPSEILWNRLRASYPKVTAFECSDGCEILVIQPQDIGLLPRENWVYGNNSFLLHGYYNYRYLILARLGAAGKQGRYILGVPGHYGNNEKYMAAMFGFDRFVRSTRQPPRDSRFGYWYTELKFT